MANKFIPSLFKTRLARYVRARITGCRTCAHHNTELSTNEQTRKEKTDAVETLHAEIDQLEASIAKLTEDITDLTKAVAELDAAMAKATQIRAEEKATNTETIKDQRNVVYPLAH